MSQPISVISQIVEQVRAAQRLDRPLVEKLIHAPIDKTSGTAFFETYEAKDVALSGLSANIELRMPIAGSGATGGAILTMRIIHGCPRRSEVEARYKPWTIANIPHGRSLDEETIWSRTEAWGDFAFGFAERDPDCLSSVSFRTKDKPDAS